MIYNCVECKTKLTPENAIVITTEFVVCKDCCEGTQADWDDLKVALRDMGIDPDACTFIHDISELDNA